ncbi:HDL417Wp [Eremothecium sinecaudum]|uniref:Ras modification protein ERF4 n=1 Tax=Eremothecium sinecaudum TaxID=45286 RepID=A0A120K240_9SACH|nr:HDL417Wp [Eremothecium sinecaudum]AMD20327.1 HDL417Wp [Eremothecium sinecaudum]
MDEASNSYQYFNCHEFFVTKYQEIGSSTIKEYPENDALCITHFPNIYHAANSKLFDSTRIVRIPRQFDKTVHYPYFSEYLPGNEPAALRSTNDSGFNPFGIYDGQLFGKTSLSPLSNYLTAEQFREIVSEINEYLREGYQVHPYISILHNVADALTFNIWSRLFGLFSSESPLQRLEEYIEQVNERSLFKDNGLRMISLRRSGYLSLDIEIPKPELADFIK